MNELLIKLSRDQGITIPLINGESEGLSGHARVIIPQETPCYECTMWMLPSPYIYPLSVISDNPRIPEHCVTIAAELEFPRAHGLKHLSYCS